MSKKPVNMVGYFPGGARFGLISIIFARHVEQALGEPIANFLQAGSIGGSVGSIIASAVATENSMEKLEKTFIEEVGNFIPYDEKHYHKQIKAFASKSILNKANMILGLDEAERETHLYSIDKMKKALTHCFGNATFDDLKHNLFVTSHATSGENQGPYDFYRVDTESLKPDSPLCVDNETLKINIVDAILASSACSTVFPSHHVSTTDTHHVDIARVDNGITQMTKLDKSINNDFGMGIVEFGSFLDIMPSPEEYNRLGIVEMTIDQTMSTLFGRHTKMDSRNFYETFLGKNNCHILELSEEHLKRDLFNYSDMLDSRPKETQKTVDSVETFIDENPDKISMVADFLVENRAAHEAYAMAQQSLAVPIEQKPNWLDNVINLFDRKPKQQETHPEAESTPQKSAGMHPQ